MSVRKAAGYPLEASHRSLLRFVEAVRLDCAVRAASEAQLRDVTTAKLPNDGSDGGWRRANPTTVTPQRG